MNPTSRISELVDKAIPFDLLLSLQNLSLLNSTVSTLFYAATSTVYMQYLLIDGLALQNMSSDSNGSQFDLEVFGCRQFANDTVTRNLTHLYNRTGFYSIVVNATNSATTTSTTVQHLVDSQLVALISDYQTDWNTTAADPMSGALLYPFWTNGGVASHTHFECTLNGEPCDVSVNASATNSLTPRLNGVASLSKAPLAVGSNQLALYAENAFGPPVWRNCSVVCDTSVQNCTIRCESAIAGLVGYSNFEGTNTAFWTRGSVGSVVVTGLLGSGISIGIDYNDGTTDSAFQTQFAINTTQVLMFSN